MVEAARPLIEFGFFDLDLNRIWIAYFDGNAKSRRVAEKLGFTYSHFAEKVRVEALDEYKKEHYMLLTKEDFNEGMRLDYMQYMAKKSEEG